MRPRQLVPPDHLVTIGIALMVGLDIFTTSLLAPPGNVFTPGAIVLHVGIGIGLLMLAFVSVYDPRSAIDMKIAHWTFQVLSIAAGERAKSWFSCMRETVKARSITLIMIVVELSVAFLLGAVLALTFYI